MSEEAETPQQRQARLRQQKREAKIKASAQDRLDKITTLSGRTPESIRNESPMTATPPPVASSPTPSTADNGRFTPATSRTEQTTTQEQLRLQEEYMRVLLGGAQTGQDGQGEQQGMPNEDDPMVKMMQAMLGGLSGDPNAPAAAGGLPFSADDISKMTGIPSFLTNMFMGGKQQPAPSPDQVKVERTWKIVRIIFSVIIGIYTIFVVNRSIDAFGQNPPAPATAQNPFVVFLMGELLFNGARIALSGRPATQVGFKSYLQSGRDVARDGAVVVFLLGLYSWWAGYT